MPGHITRLPAGDDGDPAEDGDRHEQVEVVERPERGDETVGRVRERREEVVRAPEEQVADDDRSGDTGE
jgi:hypothetical protein